MKIEATPEELRKHKIFVATPMYGGMCSGHYTKSCLDLATMCAKYNVGLKFFYIYNESLIPRARNYCADIFLRDNEFTHLMFIDADIAFKAEDVLSLAILDKDIIGGAYPKKCISWEKVYKVCNDERLTDKIKENSNIIENYIGDFVFNVLDNTEKIQINEPAKVSEIGTGFMMIKRQALENFKKFYKNLSYKPDHIRSKDFNGDREIHAFFDCAIDKKTRRYLSEDYYFCQMARKMGTSIYLCPWMCYQHVGSYIYNSSLTNMAELGLSPGKDKI